MRSRCRRSIITASTPSSAASKSCVTTQPSSVRVVGQQRLRAADADLARRPACAARAGRSARRANASRRRRSAPSAARNPSPLAWRKVSMSSRPWVGCALRPSPALISAVPGRGVQRPVPRPRRRPCGARRSRARPSLRWSCSVSRAVSPLLVDEVEASKFSTSAPSRCAASWKLEARARRRLEEQRAYRRAGQRAAQRDIAAVGEAPARGRAGARARRAAGLRA